MAWAMRTDLTGKLSAEHRLVLIVLADHASFDGTGAWPAQARVAMRLGITDRSVRRALARLEALGLIVRGDQRITSHIPENRRPVVWNLRLGGRVNPEEPTTEDATLPVDNTPSVHREDSSVPPAGRTPVTVRADTGGHSDRTAVSAKPTTKPTTEQPPNPRDAHHSDSQPRPVDNPGRRPDGTCRRCDEPHPTGTACRPLGDPVAGMAKVRAALDAARAAAREDNHDE